MAYLEAKNEINDQAQDSYLHFRSKTEMLEKSNSNCVSQQRLYVSPRFPLELQWFHFCILEDLIEPNRSNCRSRKCLAVPKNYNFFTLMKCKGWTIHIVQRYKRGRGKYRTPNSSILCGGLFNQQRKNKDEFFSRRRRWEEGRLQGRGRLEAYTVGKKKNWYYKWN